MAFKYKDVFEELRRDIRAGRFDGRGVLPSEHMLMRRFAVARGTVRRALDELRRINLLSGHQGAPMKLAFRARERADGTFAVIVPDAYYQFYSRICGGIDCAVRAAKTGFTLLSADVRTNDPSSQIERVLKFAEVCVREKVSGVFFQPIQMAKESEQVNRAILSVFDNAGIPVVLIDSDIVPPPCRSGYDLVGVDNIAVGYDLGRHVLSRGAKRVIYFSKPYAAPTSMLRGYGVSLAVTEAGLPWRNENAVFAEPDNLRMLRRLFAGKRAPDAIVASNDYVASLLLKGLEKIGRGVPQDVLLAGVNGDSLSAESTPPITTAVQPCERIGAAAVGLMLERIADPGLPPRSVCFSAQLEQRASTEVRKGRRKKGGRS